MTLVTKLVGDPRKHVRLWLSNCWLAVVVLVGFGAPYAFGGLHATSLPGAYASINHIPGGQHTYGTVLALAGLCIAYGILPALHHDGVHYYFTLGVLFVTAWMTGMVIIGFAISWAITGLLLWQPMIYWGTVASLSILALLLKPSAEPLSTSLT